MTFLAGYVILFYGLIEWHNVVALSCISNEPVCGNDGNTYKTICHLSLARNKNEDLLPLHEGHCQFTIDEAPKYSYIEESSILGRSKKEKLNKSFKKKKLKDTSEKRFCHDNWFPVCGSDGNTYANKCTALYETLTNPTLYIIHSGECKTNEQQKSKSTGQNDKPITFNSGKNLKVMTDKEGVFKGGIKQNFKDRTEEKETFKVGKKLNFKDMTDKNGNFKGSKKQNLKDATEENMACNLNISPVCGSDGMTYPNKCFALYATLTNRKLYVKHSGKCKENDIQSNTKGTNLKQNTNEVENQESKENKENVILLPMPSMIYPYIHF